MATSDNTTTQAGVLQTSQSNERYSRQKDIVPPDRLAACRATVIGVGAIGRQVALQLAAIGVPWLQLIDFDFVEPSNLASQGYLEEDLSKPKVEATGELCRRINSNLELHQDNERFRRSMEIGTVIFCAVDKIDIRRTIWDAVKDKATFFTDGRMSAEVLRVLTVCDAASRKHYPTTLFTAGEAYAGSCTAKTTIYCANIAAGMMIAQFTKWLRGLPVEPDVSINLLSTELSVPIT
jgi:tRNA A37 threonylcarbamoyladenosine dehydratase